MGNAVPAPCFVQQNPTSSSSSSVKIVFSEGPTRFLKGRHIAGDVMFEFPDKMVCHADSFFMGMPVPALALDDELMPGQTYFVLPIDRFACKVLSPALLSALGSSSSFSFRNNKTSKSSSSPPIKFGESPSPFEYIRGSNGRVVIKVKPEFITRLINGHGDDDNNNNNEKGSCNNDNYSFLCSTPELKKHYDQLVKSKDHVWSPKLETISEHNNKLRFPPCRFLGLESKEKP